MANDGPGRLAAEPAIAAKALGWRVAAVSAVRAETATARTLVLDVPGWPGHEAGQHVDVRLTAPDGYTAVRSYSIASTVDGDRVEITVEQVVDGEVSSYLAGVAGPGDQLEVRGPIGGWFAWRATQAEPVQLIGGGSGIVPLMAMVRARAAAASSAPFRLLYSTRRPQSVIYRAELERRAADDLPLTLVYTRSAPPGWSRPPGRIDAALLADTTFAPDEAPTCYVCGPTPFVEAVADQLLAAGHAPGRVRTERFGGQS